MSTTQLNSVQHCADCLSDHLTRLICHHENGFQMTFLFVWYAVCFLGWFSMTPLLLVMVSKMVVLLLMWAKVKQREL